MPDDLWDMHFCCVKVLTSIYCVAEGSTRLFSTLDSSWTKLPPSIGTMGRTRPVMAFTITCLDLLSL